MKRELFENLNSKGVIHVRRAVLRNASSLVGSYQHLYTFLTILPLTPWTIYLIQQALPKPCSVFPMTLIRLIGFHVTGWYCSRNSSLYCTMRYGYYIILLLSYGSRLHTDKKWDRHRVHECGLYHIFVYCCVGYWALAGNVPRICDVMSTILKE